MCHNQQRTSMSIARVERRCSLSNDRVCASLYVVRCSATCNDAPQQTSYNGAEHMCSLCVVMRCCTLHVCCRCKARITKRKAVRGIERPPLDLWKRSIARIQSIQVSGESPTPLPRPHSSGSGLDHPTPSFKRIRSPSSNARIQAILLRLNQQSLGSDAPSFK